MWRLWKHKLYAVLSESRQPFGASLMCHDIPVTLWCENTLLITAVPRNVGCSRRTTNVCFESIRFPIGELNWRIRLSEKTMAAAVVAAPRRKLWLLKPGGRFDIISCLSHFFVNFASCHGHMAWVLKQDLADRISTVNTYSYFWLDNEQLFFWLWVSTVARAYVWKRRHLSWIGLSSSEVDEACRYSDAQFCMVISPVSLKWSMVVSTCKCVTQNCCELM